MTGMGGFQTLIATAGNGEVAPKNEPARAGGERRSRSVRFSVGDAR
jgi:hypothetical protein